MTFNRTILILGATGGIGGEVARRLLARGWTVRALNRNPDRLSAADRAAGITWIRGDAMSAADVAAAAGGAAAGGAAAGGAADGVSVILHAVNPPGYRNWGRLVLPMIDNTIAAAQRCGARIVLPGTVYNFGPDAFPVLTETSPQRPVTAKGRIRVELERRLRAASEAGTSVLIVRAGDFFGPRAANNWFSQGLVRPGRPVTAITDPGRPGVGHQWAYLPDVAETMVGLLEQSDALDRFAVFHMAGHWDEDGTHMIGAIRRAAGDPTLKVRRLPWLLLRLASPVVPLFRELAEMRYLWTRPVRLDNGRLAAFLGAEPHTPLDSAVRETLIGLGCLDAAPALNTADPVRGLRR